jgi:hypothetical protein
MFCIGGLRKFNGLRLQDVTKVSGLRGKPNTLQNPAEQVRHQMSHETSTLNTYLADECLL